MSAYARLTRWTTARAAAGSERWADARAFLASGVWREDSRRSPRARIGVVLLRMAILIGDGFGRDSVLLRASALTYFSLLSIVPMLAIIGSIVSALGVTENVLGAIVSQIAPAAPEAAEQLLGMASNVSLGRLGTVGAVTLFLTSLLGIGTVERALNHIFRAPRERPWARRLPDYLMVLIVAPLLLGVALSLDATARNEWFVQSLHEYPRLMRAYELGLGQSSTLLFTAGFVFFYWFMPNVKVRPTAALLGGVLAALGVELALGLYVGLSSNAARNDVIYGSLAQLSLFFVWLYGFWVIVLAGAEIASAWQNLDSYTRERVVRLTRPVTHEWLGVRVACEIARAFRDSRGPCSAAQLAGNLDQPESAVGEVLAELRRARIVSSVRHPGFDDGFQLARPAESVTLIQLLAALRGEPAGLDASASDTAAAVLAELRRGESEAAQGRTLASLLD